VALRNVLESLLVMWCGSTILVIIFCISIRNRQLNQVITICVKQSTDTNKEYVPATKEVKAMYVCVKCMLCYDKVKIDKDNCVLHLFTRQPAYSWCELYCDICENQDLDGDPQEFFFDPQDWEVQLEKIKRANVSIIENEWIDNLTYKEYLSVWGKELEPQTLTEHQEKEILFLRWLLEHNGMRGFDEQG